MTLDFLEQLQKYLSTIGLKMPVKIGGLETSDSISIYALPNGDTIREFYNGIRDDQLPFEFLVKTKSKQRLALESLEKAVKALRNKKIISQNGSYSFRKLKITSIPSFVGEDPGGFFYYSFQIQVELRIRKDD